MMTNYQGYLLNCTKYRDSDLICEFLTEKGLVTFVNRGALKQNSKLNCNIYRLCFLEIELYKGNQKYYMIRNLKLIKSTNLNDINLENAAFYNFLTEITMIFCKNNSFNLNLYEDFKNTLDSIYLNEDKYFYVLLYFRNILNENGIIYINNDYMNTKNNLIDFFEYNKITTFINEISEKNIKILMLNDKNINVKDFKNCFFILTLIYETGFNQKLNSSELIYII